MTNRALHLLIALAFGSGALVSAPAAPKAPAPPAPKPAPAASVAAPAAAPGATLSPDDELLVIKLTPYHPTLVRDPFSAPSDAENANKGDLIDDISVKGRIVTNGKVLAVVSDSRGNVRWLPAGYRFRDGELYEITEKTVVFHQRDVNSTSGAFRTVVRPFKREGEK
jgi:hypothetical protein